MDGSSVVSGGEASEVLHAVEAALDTVALPVGDGIMWDGDLAPWVAGDHRLGPHAGDQSSQGVAVIGLVGDDGRALVSVKQGWRLDDIAALAGGDDEAQGTAQRVRQHVDLGGQSASGTPQRLILGPPFPLAACW